ncbi:MAG TPA: lysylphosphatidylglycerol synthase transmembrane domain-containing protein [Burkholderiales bacterium]|nr:lysylphosphatidylglycerol synthase transmembrane domain-containing protein [Burkholderiales bacterium]
MTARAKYLLAAKVLLSIALLGVVLRSVHPAAILRALSEADFVLVLAWYALYPIIVWLSAWRWELLAPGLSLSMALKYTWIGIFFGHVLPGAIAGDVAKGLSLALKEERARKGLAASIVAEKAIGLAALLLFFDIACAVVWNLYGEALRDVRNLAVIALVLSLLAIAAGTAAMMFAHAVSRRSAAWQPSGMMLLVRRLGDAIEFYRADPAVLAKAFLISCVIHVINIVAFYLSFRALRIDAGMPFAAVVYPVVSVILLIPISISGIGVRDATLAVLFSLFGLPPASGVAVSWLNLIAMIPNTIIGGLTQLYEMYRSNEPTT